MRCPHGPDPVRGPDRARLLYAHARAALAFFPKHSLRSPSVQWSDLRPKKSEICGGDKGILPVSRGTPVFDPPKTAESVRDQTCALKLSVNILNSTRSAFIDIVLVYSPFLKIVACTPNSVKSPESQPVISKVVSYSKIIAFTVQSPVVFHNLSWLSGGLPLGV